MRINKKGFTLIELLAVIALLALLTGLAVPNIISTINNNKRDAFLLDAKRMVSKAEYLLSFDKNARTNLNNSRTYSKVYSLDDLNEKAEFQTDADGNPYVSAYVKITKPSSDYVFCICVVGSMRQIAPNGNCSSTSDSYCVKSTELKDITIIKDK